MSRLHLSSTLLYIIQHSVFIDYIFDTTSYNNPKGNAETERMIRTMKEELVWLRKWENELELTIELDKWVENYNTSYLSSAYGYHTPIQVEVEYYKNHDSHQNAA